MSLLDRIIDRLHCLFYSQKKTVSLGSRFIAIVVAILTITTVFPTLAEEITSQPNPVVESPAPDPSVSNEPVNSQPTSEPTPSSSSSASPEPTPTESDDETKIKVAKVQPHISFRFPTSIAVDPRATVAYLPQISISGGSIGMLCLSSNSLIDVATKNVVNDDVEGSLMVAGDLSSHVRISGSLAAITGFLNSGNGVRISAVTSRVANSIFYASYVELTGADLASEFCSKAANHKSIAIRALGLEMGNVKTRVDFNKPSGK